MSIFSKIKKAISRPLRQIAAPLLSGVPVVGGALSSAVNASLVNTTAAQRGERQFPPVPGGGTLFPEFGGPPVPPIPTNFGPAFPRAGMSGLPAVISRVGGPLVRTTTGLISKIILPSGAAFSRKNAAALIRRVGFEAAAVALGISLVEAAEILLQDSKRRGRRKGITAANIRNARRTACMVSRMARDLNVKPAPARRARSCR